MQMTFSDYSAGEILKYIRTSNKLTQEEFGSIFAKTHGLISDNENNRKRIYIDDFIKVLKKFSVVITFLNNESGRKVILNEYEPKDLLRVFRESTGKTQGEFANDIGYKNDWAYSIEAGINNYYANDLFLLASKNGYEIKLSYKGDKYEN